jgi:serine/threonine protein kinase
VFDTATDDEGVLIVMEYVEGEALSKALRRGPLEPERVAGMVRDLGDALDHAHAQGVVHRDVKPGNVLLRKDGMTKLVDLGIATASDHTKITHSGMVLGTASYMAPEQLEGGKMGPATDVYALAVVAYEALTGERAREGRTPMEIAHRIATSPPPDLRETMPGAAPAAAEILKRAMARDPSERPRSAGELANGLARALEAPPTVATRVVPPTRPSEPAREAPPPPPTGPVRTRGAGRPRRPVAAIVIAMLILALAAATVVGAVLSSGGDDEPASSDRQQQADSGKAKKNDKPKEDKAKKEPKADRSPEAAPPPAEPPPEESAPPQEQSAPTGASGSELNEQGFQLMQQGDYAGAVPILQDAVAAWPEDSRDIEYAYALFNLGKSLNRSGNPEAAIPYLEKRLTWDDQRETVQAELDLAEQNAEEG